MKLHVDKGNLQGLKCLISASIKGKTIELNVINIGDRASAVEKIPKLEISPETIIYSANAAARYLYGEDAETVETVDQWAEWEATQLQPLVHHALAGKLGHGKTDSKTLMKLSEQLQYAESFLGDNVRFLGGSSVSVVDVIIWSSLFPVFNAASPLKDIGDKFPKLKAWFTKLSSEAAFQDATKTIFPQVESQLKVYVQNHAVPSLPDIHTSDLYSKKMTATRQDSKVAVTSEVTSEPAVTEEERRKVVDTYLNGQSKAPKPRERKHPLVPQANEKNMLITSALPYVNNCPHLGNIIGCVLSADVYSRFCRLRNYNVLYICGTDEYGTATETKAVEEGLKPKEICDKYNKLHTEIYKWFNVDFDYFGRTTTQEQTKIAQDIFWDLHKNNYIIKDNIDQLQCTKCDRFLADRFVEGTCPFCRFEDARGDQCDKCGKLINAIELKNPRCKVCGSPPVVKTSSHLFLDLPSLQSQLHDYTEDQFQKGLFSHNVKVITKSWIRDGLKPRCISRDLKWGTPVPLEGYTDKVFYVWYDAPIGYISITANYTKDWEKWWKNPEQVQLYNFMAKDNIPFHSIIFPCTLLGTKQKWTLLNHLNATEYLNYEDTKFSKSRGVGVFGDNAQDTGIPADIYRFYLLYVRPEGQDSNFNWDDFVLKNNSELLNNLGNFINRGLSFLKNNFGGVVPEMKLEEPESELLALVTRELKGYIENLETIKLRDGIRNILSISRLGNQYMQVQKPWVLVKGSDAEKKRAGTVVSIVANISCLLSVMIQPYMPDVSKTIQSQLNAPVQCNVLTEAFVSYLPTGHKIGQPKPLFQKIEMSFANELKKRFAGKEQNKTSSAPTNKTDPPQEAAGIGSNVPDPVAAEKLAEQVSKQGEVVRQMKAQKAEKAKIDVEVAKLLDLKRQQAIAEGKDPNEMASSSGRKKKNKKK